MEINKISKGKKTTNKSVSEASRQEASSQEASRQEASRQEASSQEASSQASRNKTTNRKEKIVHFNNYTESLSDSDNDKNELDNYESDDENNSDSIIDNYNNLNIQKDPTDIYDSDEEEINEEVNDMDNFINDELVGEEYAETIKYIYNLFLNKHKHLDNFRNREIILKLCTMSINSIPENISNPIFYLNFIESSINHLKNMTTEEIEKISKENDEIK